MGGGYFGFQGAFWKIWTKIYCAARNLLVHHSSLSHTTYVETNDTWTVLQVCSQSLWPFLPFVADILFEIWMIIKCELLFVSGDQSGTGVNHYYQEKKLDNI